jgi:ppGpp synthetase/RelA/SpoT-type nucleotidyltranferase
MVDKLRGTRGMELSRMQDVAGARIVVGDLSEQDEARDKIVGFYEDQGCACRVVDRREDPRFGYKAVHVIVQIDGMPLEIQIRTELQDAWAQIVERTADRWGRGIRYGEDPLNPDAKVRSGHLETTRRGAVETLMELTR